MRFERGLSDSVLSLFREGCLLAPLLSPLSVSGLPLDLQFREGDTIQLYCGQTSLLSASLRDDTVKVSAHPTYTRQPCATSLFRTWTAQDAPAFANALSTYLEGVEVAERWTHKEGRVQARWMQQTTPWHPIDREAVLGYPDEATRLRALDVPEVAAGISAVHALCASQGWASPASRIASNEVDQLAVDDTGALVLVELKHGRGGDAWLAPLQVLRYAHEWSQSVHAVLPGIERLVRSKQALGLLPQNLPTPQPRLRLVLAFGEDMPSAESQRRLQQVCACVETFLPAAAPSIEVWRLSEEGGCRVVG